MKKTLRLLVTEECNMDCKYCCNKLDEIQSNITKLEITQINWSKYDTLCITGGEPLLLSVLRLNALIRIARHNGIGKVYLYTNGLLLNQVDSWELDTDCINIGIHYKNQMIQIFNTFMVLSLTNKILFYVEDKHRDDFLPNISDKYVKTWKMNDCFNNINTEDWISLITKY